MSKSDTMSDSGRPESMLSQSSFNSLTIPEHQSLSEPSDPSELSEWSALSEQSQGLQRESDLTLTTLEPRASYRSSQSQSSITVASKIAEIEATRMRSSSVLERFRPISSLSFRVGSTNSSGRSTPTSAVDFNPGKVQHYGEVQTSSFRRKRTSEFFILTDRYILRYRNEKKATLDFPMLLSTSSGVRHRRGSQSIDSLQEMAPPPAPDSTNELSSEKSNRIRLGDIISVQVLKNGNRQVTIEVTWLPQAVLQASALVIQLDRENGRPHFLENLSDLVKENIVLPEALLSQAHQRAVVEGLESSKSSVSETDNYKIYKVTRRRANPTPESARLSLDDITPKDPPVVMFLVLSNHMIDFIPLSKIRQVACGVVTLQHAFVNQLDDSFDLTFRTPQKPAVTFELASVYSYNITLEILRALETSLPDRPMSRIFKVPKSLERRLSNVVTPDCPPASAFSRILEAYCAAFDIDRCRFQYAVHTGVEDAPRLQLLSPGGVGYTVLELIAVMRALQFSDYFGSVSFAGVDLDGLRACRDEHGPENVRNVSALVQELRAVLRQCKLLRRLDFTNSISTPELKRVGKDRCCGILKALRTVCLQQATNVDWVILNGIPLSQPDVDDLIAMIRDRSCHLRAVELSGCLLDKWHLEEIMGVLPTQYNTLEAINISNNQGCPGPGLFRSCFMNCAGMRILNLSNIRLSFESESIIPLEVLQHWRLEELYLSHTRFNAATLRTIISYARGDASCALRILHLDNTEISTMGIAELLKALGNRASRGRKLHLDISGNSLYPLDPIAEMLRNNMGPTSLAMQQAEFHKQRDYQNLAKALIANTSLQRLDMTDAIFEFDPDEETSMALKEILANNKSIEHLDISGGSGRVEASDMGRSINHALCGLFKNSTLKVLVVRNQQIDGNGAAILAQVLRNNTTLTEIHLENNNISLGGFFALVQVLRYNRTVTFLSDTEDMKTTALEKINKYMSKMTRAAGASKLPGLALVRSHFVKSTAKKTSTKEPIHTVTSASMKFAGRWKREQTQLRLYLERNKGDNNNPNDLYGGTAPSPDDAEDDDSDAEYPIDNHSLPPPPNMVFEDAVEALGLELARDFAWVWARMRVHTYGVVR